MRDKRTWVPVDVIWDLEPRAAPVSPRGWQRQSLSPPLAAERTRPPRRAVAPPERRGETRDDEDPTPRRRKGEGKRRGHKLRPHEIERDY